MFGDVFLSLLPSTWLVFLLPVLLLLCDVMGKCAQSFPKAEIGLEIFFFPWRQITTYM